MSYMSIFGRSIKNYAIFGVRTLKFVILESFV